MYRLLEKGVLSRSVCRGQDYILISIQNISTKKNHKDGDGRIDAFKTSKRPNIITAVSPHPLITCVGGK